MSSVWPLFTNNTFHLTQNMRATNPLFADWLLDIGNSLTDPQINLLDHNIRIVHSPLALIRATFGTELNEQTLPLLTRHIILCPTNKNTAIFNEEVLNMVTGPSILKYSIDYNIVERATHPLTIPEEFLHTLVPPGMPPHTLHLKIGAVYILLRNMCVADGLCNGTRFILTKINGHIL
jgi:ATP-dependent DNA helicase PIF1